MPDLSVREVICKDINRNEHIVTVDKLRWRPSAYGVVIKDNAVLLAPQFNGYDLPGGGIELGEMPEAAVLREIQEETGIVAANPRLLQCSSSFFVLAGSEKGEYVQSILLYYVCDYEGGELSMAGFTEDEKKFNSFPEWHGLKNGTLDISREQIASSYDWRELIPKVIGL